MIITKELVEQIVKPKELVEVIKKAFIAFSSGSMMAPPPFSFSFTDRGGEVCVKTAIAPALPTYTIKQVSVIHDNKKKGLPTLNATMNVYDRETGKFLAVIDEQGWLTNMRTAVAGAIADKLFRSSCAATLGVVGAGTQAEFQIRMILAVNGGYKRVMIYNRDVARARTLSRRLKKEYPSVLFEAAPSIVKLLSGSNTVLTATPTTEPLIKKIGQRGPTTIIAIGADMPEKCEVDPGIYAQADKIFVDSRASNRLLGDISRALLRKTIGTKDITAEIGEVLSKKKKGRTADDEFIIVKLVGIGAQDLYAGNYVYRLFKK